MIYLLAAFIASILALIYPFVIYPLLLMALPRHVSARLKGKPPVSAALLIAARDEVEVVPDLLQRVRRLQNAHPGLTVFIWDDGSVDGTTALLEQAADHVTLVRAATPVGKAEALRRLQDHVPADAELLFFMDANTDVAPMAMTKLWQTFSDAQIGAVSARSAPQGSRGAVQRRYWALEEWIKQLETKTGSIMGCDGAFWAVRRMLYRPARGLESDDFVPSMRVVQMGYRVVSVPDAVVFEPAIADRRAPARAMRVAAGAWHGHRRLLRGVNAMSRLDRFKYTSHKLVRWFSGLWLSLAAVSGAAIATILGYGTIFAETVVLGSLAGVLGLPVWHQALRAASGTLATTLGVLRAQFGYGVAQWTTVRDP